MQNSRGAKRVGGLYMFSASWGGRLKDHREKLTQLSTSKKNTGRESGALLLAIFSLLVVVSGRLSGAGGKVRKITRL